MSILAQFKKARATGQGSNFARPGKGKVIIKDMVVKDTYGETHRFILELYTKEATPIEFLADGSPVQPNAVGSSWSVQEQLIKVEGAMERAKGLTVAVLGDEGAAMTDDQVTAAFAEFCRLDDAGHTDPKKGPCPLRGVELAYETRRKAKKGQANTPDDQKMIIPQFKLLDVPDSQIQANRATLDGAGGGEGAAPQ